MGFGLVEDFVGPRFLHTFMCMLVLLMCTQLICMSSTGVQGTLTSEDIVYGLSILFMFISDSHKLPQNDGS